MIVAGFVNRIGEVDGTNRENLQVLSKESQVGFILPFKTRTFIFEIKES